MSYALTFTRLLRLLSLLVASLVASVAEASSAIPERVNSAPSNPGDTTAWHGQYRALGPNERRDITLGPSGTAVYSSLSCLAGPSFQARAEWSNDILILTPTTDTLARKPSHASPRVLSFLGEAYRPLQLIPITWGDRRLLIDADHMIYFCNEVNQGNSIHRNRNVFRPIDTSLEIRPPGLPAVPEPWRKYLLPAPLTAHVTSVSTATRPFQARIDLGSEAGLQTSMTLVAKPVGQPPVRATVTRVGPTESTVIWDSWSGALKVGRPLYSRLPEAQP